MEDSQREAYFENRRLADRRRAEFLAQTGERWQGQEERLVFVHDRLTPFELALIAYDAYELFKGETDPEIQFPEGPARQTFAAYNAALPEHRKFEKIGEVAESDVYAEPLYGPGTPSSAPE